MIELYTKPDPIKQFLLETELAAFKASTEGLPSTLEQVPKPGTTEALLGSSSASYNPLYHISVDAIVGAGGSVAICPHFRSETDPDVKRIVYKTAPNKPAKEAYVKLPAEGPGMIFGGSDGVDPWGFSGGSRASFMGRYERMDER